MIISVLAYVFLQYYAIPVSAYGKSVQAVYHRTGQNIPLGKQLWLQQIINHTCDIKHCCRFTNCDLKKGENPNSTVPCWYIYDIEPGCDERRLIARDKASKPDRF